MTGFTYEEMCKIVAAAARAPSGDNIQPWHFESQDDGQSLEVYMDAETQNGKIQAAARIASLVAIGATLENALVAARGYFGREFKWQALDTKDQMGGSICVARLEVDDTTRTEPNEKMLESIFERHTNRVLYDSLPLSDAELSECQNTQDDIAKEYPNVSIQLFNSRQEIEEIGQLLASAMPLLFNIPSISGHVFSNIRFPKQNELPPPTGMPAATLADGLIQQKLLRFLSIPRVTNIAMKLGFAKFIGLGERRMAQSASAFISVSANSSSTHDLLSAGIAMQKIWLMCTKVGLAVQPAASPVLHAWFKETEGSTYYTAKQWPKVKKLIKEFTTMLGEKDELMPAMLLRIGHAPANSARTGRRSIEELFTYNKTEATEADI